MNGPKRRRISQEGARAMGRDRYFTGQPCAHGHGCERYVAKPNSCVECLRLRNLRPKNKRWRRQWANGGSPAARARNRHKNQKRDARVALSRLRQCAMNGRLHHGRLVMNTRAFKSYVRRVVKSALTGNLDAIRTLGALALALNHPIWKH